MREYLLSVLRQDSTTASYEIQNFNLVQLIYLSGLMLLGGVVYVCIPDPKYFYCTLVIIFLVLVTFLDANRTGNMFKCAVLVSLITNLIYLPLCFYGYGKLICCIPLYYIVGILYTVLIIHGRTGIMLSLFETIYMCAATVFIGKRLPDFLSIELDYTDYIAIVIALFIVCLLSVVATSTKISQYYIEYDKMRDTHLKVTDAYNSKDIFFANTSHEIRTPLNAIVGTVNLLLDEDLNPKVRENVYNILNSCNALLSITDELMTLSNTDSSNLTFTESKYDFAEMIADIVNMMSVRLMESRVTLYVDIDNSLPRYLIGDGKKVRQLFINILNNAVKYTKEGKIVFTVTGEETTKGIISIHAEVMDTGIGIKPEALEKLFDDYSRDEEDEEKREIEGTGLGLSLCKEIVDNMGGSIRAESTYHQGSTFIFDIRQKIHSQEPVARVASALREPAIIYEETEELADNIRKVLESLKISSIIVSDRIGFEDAILTDKYKYLFISSDRYAENKRFIDRKIGNHRIVIVSDISRSVHVDRNCYLITRPVTIINASMAYNNTTGAFSREIIHKGGFVIPEATILVVDDNLTNLDVASGLLKKYEAKIITAVSGYECLNIMEKTNVDLIFMDYMMPDMNGIDTLYELRKLDTDNARTVPVVALTANVVSGAKEMFLDAGFAAYVSKPIDPSRLELTLKEFIGRDKIRVKI